jgi:hypothetical protein
MSNNVFTIFNHGTDFHRDANPDELISQLSMAMDGKEARIVQTGEGCIPILQKYRNAIANR